jgi:antitoxin (DNA-binding transcriptional repressor) of toxin-antitoxin stability system
MTISLLNARSRVNINVNMKLFSMRELRQNSEAIVQDLRRGQSLTLTYRGKPWARLLPIPTNDREIVADDPFYTLADHAEAGADEN